MKKIFMSILAIALTVGAVSGTAYALFTDTATISGITITAGNADLKIGNGDSDHADSIVGGVIPMSLYPGIGFTLPPVNLYNNSTSNINLRVKSQITDWQNNGNGDWGALADNLYSRVINVTNGSSYVYGDWHTLREWHDTGYDLPGSSIPSATNTLWTGKASYVTEYTIHSDVGNGIANASIRNIVITMTGTQAP